MVKAINTSSSISFSIFAGKRLNKEMRKRQELISLFLQRYFTHSIQLFSFQYLRINKTSVKSQQWISITKKVFKTILNIVSEIMNAVCSHGPEKAWRSTTEQHFHLGIEPVGFKTSFVLTQHSQYCLSFKGFTYVLWWLCKLKQRLLNTNWPPTYKLRRQDNSS